MMTGFHQNYIGCNQHRNDDKEALPYGIRPIPQLLKEAGYYTCTMASGQTDCTDKTMEHSDRVLHPSTSSRER